MPLDVVTEKPKNAETPWTGLLHALTPAESFFVRNHFDEPALDPETYHLRIVGEVQRAKLLTLAQLQRMPQHKVTCVLECAGNGRTRMVPRPSGVPWGDRAVGCATWEGPSLAEVLAMAPPEEGVAEVVFRGADLGIEGGTVAHFERSLPLAQATGPGPILALRMNGHPLPRTHGAPLRLLVPGHYGVESVKWLTDIRYTSRPFTGYFQTKRYVWDDGTIVRGMRVKSLLLRPHPGEPLRAGEVLLEGRAWGGRGGIAEVVAQVDEGPWQPCALASTDSEHAWRTFTCRVRLAEGLRRVRVRARDGGGDWQPLEPVVNKLGYGYNTATPVELLVGPPG